MTKSYWKHRFPWRTLVLFVLVGGLAAADEGCEDDALSPDEETIEVVYEREFEIRSFQAEVREDIVSTRITPCDDIYVCDNFNRVKSMEVIEASRMITYVQIPAGFGGMRFKGQFETFLNGTFMDGDFFPNVGDEQGVTVQLVPPGGSAGQANAALVLSGLGRILLESQNAEITGSGYTDPANYRFGVRYRFVVKVTLEIL